MGGAFLQPIGNRARLAATASRQAELKSRRFISLSSKAVLKSQRPFLLNYSDGTE
jgi:hypothetical protein